MRKISAQIFNGIKRGTMWIAQSEHLPRESLPAAQKTVPFLAWLFAGERLESAPPARKDPDRRNFLMWIASPEKIERSPEAEKGNDRQGFLRWLVSQEKLGQKPEGDGKRTNFLKWIFGREPL
ncbi:MAG: hypothetical protein HY541_01410 [Deltaproteobacteria bacterium]|nr:hypothetical protein [Deltaproteobacteria bacterium]